MRWALILAIRIYWAAWPPRWRRGCLYRESCSRYVYRTVKEEGLAGGLRVEVQIVAVSGRAHRLPDLPHLLVQQKPGSVSVRRGGIRIGGKEKDFDLTLFMMIHRVLREHGDSLG